MDFLLVVLGVVVVATGLYFVASFAFGPGEPPQPASERIATPLPDGRPLTSDDLRAATFPVTMRGYRMEDVDALIERMASELEKRSERDDHSYRDSRHVPQHLAAEDDGLGTDDSVAADAQEWLPRSGPDEGERRPAHAAPDDA